MTSDYVDYFHAKGLMQLMELSSAAMQLRPWDHDKSTFAICKLHRQSPSRQSPERLVFTQRGIPAKKAKASMRVGKPIIGSRSRRLLEKSARR